MKDLALCQLHDIERDTLRKKVGKFIAEKRNRVRTNGSGLVSVVQWGNKRRNGVVRREKVKRAARKMIEWEAEEYSRWDSVDSIEYFPRLIVNYTFQI